MAAMCPNKNLQEWKDLVKAVGEFEAFRDFMETEGEIRSPEEVQMKIEARENGLLENQGGLAASSDEVSAGSPELNSLVGQALVNNPQNEMNAEVNDQSKAFEVATQMSTQLGVEFDVINKEEAVMLTKDTPTPWSGESAFFVGGKVYFVGENFSTTMAVHEFSHPLLRHIAVNNSTQFNTMYNKLVESEEGKILVAEVISKYPELDPTTDRFKEEVMVHALTDSVSEQKASPEFNSFIKNILYAIKQALRKVFGQKIGVSKLDAATTIDQLADMLLKGDQFVLDTEAITQDDIVSYTREQTQYIEDMQRLDNKEVQALINHVYDISSRHIKTLMTNNEYEELAELLVDEDKRGDLQAIRSNVASYQTTIANIGKKAVEDMDYARKQSTALVNSLFRLETVMEKVLAHMQDIQKSGDNVDNMNKAFYYEELVDYWTSFLNEAKTALNDPKNNVAPGSPLLGLVNNVSTIADRVKNISNDMRASGVRETLYNELEPMSREIKNRYEKIIKDLKDKNAPQKLVDKWHKEYYGVTEEESMRLKKLEARVPTGTLTPTERSEMNRLKIESARGLAITPAKIDMLLKGQAGDANFFNSYLEGYLYNADPIIGGLALFVKNKMSDVMATAQSKFNEFATDMEPLLKEAGYNPHKVGELGKKVGFMDVVGKREKDGSLSQRNVWTMINKFKGYRYDLDAARFRVSEAQQAYAESGTDEAYAELNSAVADQKTLLRKYFHQEYVPEFYERQKLFERTEDEELYNGLSVGEEAGIRRGNIIEQMQMLSEPAKTQTDNLAIADQMDELWREYRQLFSLYNLDGSLKTGFEKAVSERLRTYQEESREYYEWKERRGVFQNALREYEQELIDSGSARGSEKFNLLRNEWLTRNTRTVVKDEFYEERQRILDDIASILDKLPDTDRKAVDMADSWSGIFDLAGGFRDEDGQTKANEMSDGSVSEAKRLEQEIIDKRKKYIKQSGITGLQADRLAELKAKKEKGPLSEEESTELGGIYADMKNQGLSKADSARLEGLYEELAGLSHREPTTYYLDVANNWLQQMEDTNVLYTISKTNTIDKSNADAFLNKAVVSSLSAQSSEFKTWFENNHIEKDFYNKETKKMDTRWERLYIWSVSKPNDPSYMETTDVHDEVGNVVETIAGLPSLNYYSRVVKPEYRTERVVGETVNNKGEWLPKTLDQGAADDRYINEKYTKMQQEDPKLFKVLEKLKEHHLKNQEGLGYKSRLYLDFPRISRKSTLETLQSKNIGKEKMNALTIWAKRVRDFWTGAKDDAEDGLNYKEEFNLVRVDMFDDEITNVPIGGLYDMDSADVSTDITHTMMRYMLSAERHKQLVKISPFTRSVQAVVNDPRNGIKEMDKINRFNFLNRGIKTYLTKKGESVRQKAVNNFLEREFEGKSLAGKTQDVPWLNNTANLLFKRASFGFFALNIPSALKNSFGAKFQGMIEASAGKYMNHRTFAKGEVRATKTMMEISNQIYRKGPKSLDVQLVELLDPSQDRFEDKFGESMSRTISKDTASMSWLYNFRRWVELQATLQIFYGMMYHKNDIEQTLEDGTVKKLSYADAWQVVDGKIQLKKGIDPEMGITYDAEGNIKVGKDFKQFKNRMHQVMNNLQGTYAKFDQPEAQRYLAFRFISYLRRYFTSMAVNRWGFSGRFFNARPRLNPGLADTHEGFYVTFLKTAKDTATNLGRNLKYMTSEEKRAALKVGTEVLSLAAVSALMPLLFGWDPDDDDKFEKLRQRSGALPFPFVAEDDDRSFNGWGYMENHALFLLMNIRAENEQFLPFPGYGMDDYSAMLDLKSIAFGPTVKTYKEVFEDAIDIVQGDESAYYKRKTGPYEWQQQGGAKIWSHLARTIGFTGSSVDPAKAIRGFQSVQARAK